MKKRALLGFAGVVGILASTGPAYASALPLISQNSSNEAMVWVVHDVTRQNHYELTYKHKDAQGNWISQNITPPTGSLIKISEEPLSTAIAQGDIFVQANSSRPSSEQVDELHNELVSKLHPNAVHSNTLQPSTTITGNGTSYALSGSFWTNDIQIGYNINYMDDGNGYLSLTHFDSGWLQGSGNANQIRISLYNPGAPDYSPTWDDSNWNPNLISSSSPRLSWDGSAGAEQGAQFRTYVGGDNAPYYTTYYGYATLTFPV